MSLRLFFLKIIFKNFIRIFSYVEIVILTVMSYGNLSCLYKILCSQKLNMLKTTCKNVVSISKMETNGKKHIITTKGYQKYKKFMKQRQINKIIQKTTLHESCDKWTKEVWNAINQVGKIVTKKNKERPKRATEDKEKF